MSDKKLLEENTIRRFQVLANIKSVNGSEAEMLEEGKKKSKSGKKGGETSAGGGKKEDPERFAGGRQVAGLRESDEFLDEAEGEAGTEAPAAPEMGGGEEAGGEGGDSIRPEVEALLNDINALIKKFPGGDEFEVDMEDAGGEEAGGEEAGGEEAGGEGGGAEEEEEGLMEAVLQALAEKKKKKKKEEEEEEGMMKEAKKKAKKKEDEKEESMYEGVEVVDDDMLAEELTKRVAARLVAEMKKSSSGGGAKWYMQGAPKGKKPKAHSVGKGTPFGGKKK